MSFSDAALTLAPLESRLESPLQFFVGGGLSQNSFNVLSKLFEIAGLRKPVCASSLESLTALDKVAAQTVGAVTLTTKELESPVEAMGLAQKNNVLGTGTRKLVTANDGSKLSILQMGEVGNTPILLFGAPGTPIQLMGNWIKGMAEDRMVISWETRGLFGVDYHKVNDFTIPTQVDDALAIIDSYGFSEVHAMGICGGAMLSLAFTATYSERVRSLSLWFGDYELGNKAAKTDHQRNLQALMKMVVDGQVSAGALRDTLLRGFQQLSEPDLAPLALYPYANAELLGQYCRMNYPIMSTDCLPYLKSIETPSMVVFSPDDETTHVEGSKVIAQTLGVPLVSVPSSGHLGTFKATPQYIAKALDFYRDQD